MNYRHAFHAGNHTEVFKHAALAALIARLKEKPKPFAVIDTHAGVGIYDLRSVEAQKTAEARAGIEQIYEKSIPAAEVYLGIVRSFNPSELVTYPGSPSVIRALLRSEDRLIACELHGEDAADLKSIFRGDKRVAVHNRDGYEAMVAFVPPPERRGLIFVDPPFESKEEFNALVEKLAQAYEKWPTGMFAVWYPIKSLAPSRQFIREIRASGISNCLVANFLRYPVDNITLCGSGMLFVNAPWNFDIELKEICAGLAGAFDAFGGEWSVEWLSRQ